jgi:hypothetical protein
MRPSFTLPLSWRNLRRLPPIFLVWALTATIVAPTTSANGRVASLQANGTHVPWHGEELRHVLFANYMRVHNAGIEGLKDLVVTNDLLAWRQDHKNASEDQVSEHLAKTRQFVNSKLKYDDVERPLYEILLKTIDIVSSMPGAGEYAKPAGTTLKALMESTLGKQLQQWGNVQDQIAGASQLYTWEHEFWPVQNLLWGYLQVIADGDLAITKAWDGQIGSRIGISVRAQEEQLEGDPTLDTWLDVKGLRDKVDSLDEYMHEAKAQFLAAIREVQDQTSKSAAAVQQDMAAYPVKASGPKPSAADYAAAVAEMQERQKVIDAAGSAGFILSTLIGFADKDTGRKVGAVANAAVGIATAINKYLPTVVGLDLPKALTSLSSVVLTGNVLGAVMTLLPAFGVGGPDVDTQILQGIQDIRDDLKNIQEGLDERFDRIEKGLSRIYDDMLTQFDHVLEQLSHTREELAQIQQALARLEAKVDTLGITLLGALGDIYLDPFWTAVKRFIGYRDTFGQPIKDFETYQGPENEFFVTATGRANGIAFTVPKKLFDTDPMLILAQYPPEAAIEYLSSYAQNHYDSLFPVPSLPIPNPGVWSLGARAYATLQLENPDYAERVTSQRADAIVNMGNAIQQAARQFSAPLQTPDNQGKWTNELFKQLIQDYNKSVREFSAKLRDTRLDVLDGKAYDLFGAADQPLNPATLPQETPTIPACGTNVRPISAPSNAKFAQLPASVLVARYVDPEAESNDKQAAGLSACYSARFVNEHSEELPKVIITYADLEITLALRFRWAPEEEWKNVRLLTRTRGVGPICWHRLDGVPNRPCFTPEYEMQHWDGGYRSDFETSATIADSPAVTEIKSKIADTLHARQHDYFRLVEEGLRSDNSLGTSAQKVTSAAQLVRAYAKLGWPRALEHDELFSGLLFGTGSIPADSSEKPDLSDIYSTARRNYECEDKTCTSRTFSPFSRQAHLDAPCDTNVSDDLKDNFPGDPLGDCVYATAVKRSDILAARLETHSRELAQHAYSESLPLLETTLTNSRIAERMIRPTEQTPAWFTLKRGARGQAVRTMQYLLRSVGHNVQVDGIFGPESESAVRVFQASRNLPVDGIVDDGTWPLLVVLVKRGNDGDSVRAVQDQLRFRHITDDSHQEIQVDGSYGARTEEAVRTFQRSSSLSIDGIVGPKTWKSMISS